MKEKIITKNFCMAFLSVFCSAMVMYMLMGTITEYATTMGTTATLAGLVSGIYIFGGLCSRLGSGIGLEKLGWKRLAVISMLVHFFACCCYFLVDNIMLLILVRFIHGLGFGAASNATTTIGMSILPKSRYGEATGYFMLAPPLAIGAGPYIGGLVYDHFGVTGCFTGASILSFLMLVFILLVDTEAVDPRSKTNRALAAQKQSAASAPKPSAKGLNKFLEVKAFPVSLFVMMCGFGYVSVISFYRIYAAQTGLTEVFSYFFLFYGALLIVTRFFAGRIQDKHGSRVLCIPGVIAQSVGLFLLAWNPCVLTVFLCGLGCAVGFGIMTSVGSAIVCSQAGPERRAYAVTTFYLCCDGGMGIGPAILGAIATASGYTAMYYAAALFTLLGLPIYLFSQRKKPERS